MTTPSTADPPQANAKHNDSVWSVVWTKWGKIVTGSVDETARIWSADLEPLHSFRDHRLGVVSVAASSDEPVVVTSSIDATLRFYNVEEGRHVANIQAAHGECWSVAWSPTAARVASGTKDGRVNVWNVEDVHSPRRTTIKVSSDDKHNQKRFIHSVAFSPDGRHVAAGSYTGEVFVLDVETETPLFTLQGHSKAVRSLSYAVDGYTLITASDDGRVNTFEMPRHSLVGSYTGHSSAVLGVAACPDGRHFASCGSDKRVKIWDLAMKECLHTIDRAADAVWCVAFNPEDPNLLVYGAENGEINIANISQHIS